MFRRSQVGRIAVVAAMAILVAGDTYRGGARRVIEHPDRPMPTLGTQFSPPPEPATEAADWPLTDAAPAWEVELPDDINEYDVEEVVPTPDGYLVRTRERLVALDAEGEPRWEREHVPGSSPLDTPQLDVAVVGQDLVIVGHRNPTDDRWPWPEVITALDQTTGETLWEEDEASFWSVVDGTIYLSVCYGGQDGEIGDCQLDARDPLSNRPRWSISTYASVKVVAGGGSYLVLESFPTGHESRTITVVDARSGRRLDAGFDGYQGVTTTPGSLIREDNDDDNPADGCTAELTGFDVDSGEEVWRYVSTTRKEADGAYCGDLPEAAFGERYALTDEDDHAVVLDPDTGEIEWTAPRPGFGLTATEELLLVLDESGAEPELVRYDLGTGGERWRVPLPPGEESPEALLFDETVLVYRNRGADLFGYDLGTGAGWTYDDRDGVGHWFIGAESVIVCEDSTCRSYDVR